MRPTGEPRLGFRKWFLQILKVTRIARRYDTAPAQRLEGSRFATRQLCKLAASGSRERPRVGRFYVRRPNQFAPKQGGWVQAPRWVIPGSRQQPSYRTARRQSGSPPGAGHAPPWTYFLIARRRRHAGLSLIELLVVITIIALVSALITTSVLSALNQQNQRVCLNNMLTIEAAKDEYLRDHPGATSVPSIPDFQPYFRFGIPQCPDNAGANYQNLLSLTQQVYCPKHPENQQKLSAAPSPANN
ncbi:MAG: type II secretion system protein [Chthoniobacterales bacterium]